jgi:hypothetical protein
LLANNKILIRDNLAKKRKKMDDQSCLFCTENESVKHLFCECFIAHAMWAIIYEIIALPAGADFESIAKFWLRDKNF